jgi:hypothetical protein
MNFFLRVIDRLSPAQLLFRLRSHGELVTKRQRGTAGQKRRNAGKLAAR